MKKVVSLLLAAVLALSILCTAIAEHVYLIPDSNTRKLTADELWDWDLESLGYILNEIFARHGYVFQSGGKYEYYFSCMPWYRPNEDSDNHRACYPQLNSTEWYNERLVKDVMAQMRASGLTKYGAKSVWKYFSPGFDTLHGFDGLQCKTNQVWDVYSAPSRDSFRGANGKAKVSTNGGVYAAGWENGWMLVMYETNKGAVRVGYVEGAKVKGNTSESRMLSFDYSTATVMRNVSVTDDPARSMTTIASLSANDQVTYLTTYMNKNVWAYIETVSDGKVLRGFVPADALRIESIDDQGIEEE